MILSVLVDNSDSAIIFLLRKYELYRTSIHVLSFILIVEVFVTKNYVVPTPSGRLMGIKNVETDIIGSETLLF